MLLRDETLDPFGQHAQPGGAPGSKDTTAYASLIHSPDKALWLLSLAEAYQLTTLQ